MYDTHKVLFTIGLSNGETITEEKGDYQTIPGELSPWRRAQAYILSNGVSITSLSLYTPDGKRWNLPSAGKNPRFAAFAEAEKPKDFNFYRKMGGEVMGDGSVADQEIYAVIEAKYDGGITLQLWVHNDTHACWTMVA